ncbi:MAG: hypothetical protein KAV82_15530 [Phycisphaerae bacterium]|nr:hypothetical protein [Phycisphaerae bacterium]
MYRLLNCMFVAVFLTALSLGRSAQASVIVRFDPPDITVDLGDVFNINIVADISDLVVAWGLDLTIDDESVVSLVGEPTIVPDWIAAYAPDGDGLAGVAFPNSISGSDILLATVTFSADVIGETDLLLSVTPGDFNEGFGLDPEGFDTVTFELGHVTVIPEPVTLCFLTVVVLVTARRKVR